MRPTYLCIEDIPDGPPKYVDIEGMQEQALRRPSMYLKPESKEWIGISIGRWLLVWMCVPVLILFVGLLLLQIDIERKTNLLQTEVMRSMMDLVNTNNKEIDGLRKDLRATQDEILVWYTKTNGEQKKGNKK